ncbi:MAG: methyltransferase [Flavobacterium sp. BFFFF2]|nr:MAG: methyltransferase [Flavobacterium sp. BFFFF2]
MKTPFLESVNDFSVSHEKFSLEWNQQQDMLITVPQPSSDTLSSYYQSEDYISHTDHARTLIEKLYQFVKRYTLKQKAKLLVNNNIRGTVLDVGAGTGDFLNVINQFGFQGIGFEPGEKPRNKAIEKGIHLIDDLQVIEKDSVDAITLWHVLEHIPDYEDQLKVFQAILKPGGFLIIAVPNFKSFDAQHYKQYWAAYDVPRHLWHFSEPSIKRLARENGLMWESTKPMWFDSFYVSMLSEKYQSGSGNVIKAFFVGLFSNIKALFSSEYSSKIYLLKKPELQ